MTVKSLVYGWGINDAPYQITNRDEGVGRKMCPYYRKWSSMIARCHQEKELARHPTYSSHSIDERWRYFMNFREWMYEQDWEGKQLDKDILDPNNKVYCPELCVFIPDSLNKFLTNRSRFRTQYGLGVYMTSNGKFTSRCNDGTGRMVNFGRFNTPEEAHEAYRQYKHKLACRYADQQTDPRIAHALRQWYKPNGWYRIKEAN